MKTPTRTSRASALVIALAAIAAAGGMAPAADARRGERSGQEVVDAVCAACHGSGKDKAPKIGDAKAWAARASQGLGALTDHAIKGIRSMPAHGGNAGVSDIEIERAVVNMVNRSGGHWVEPIGGATPAVLRSSQAIVENQCAKCHRDGVNGAPKIGDRAAWTPRLRNGLDQLVASAIHGHGAMPARGGLPDLSDQEIRGAIVYMFNYGVPEVAAPPPAPPPDPNHKLVAGTDVYFGLVSADALRAVQRSGQGGVQADIPNGRGYYHINISLIDNKTQVTVTDATVKLKVSDGMRSDSKALDLVAVNNAVSYGSFFQLSPGNAYNITAQIRRPGVAGEIEAKFTYKAP
jgi:cytochrome c5